MNILDHYEDILRRKDINTFNILSILKRENYEEYLGIIQQAILIDSLKRTYPILRN